MALSKSSFTLAPSGPSFAIYITETFRSRIHRIHIRDSSSVIMTKAHNAKLDYKLTGSFFKGRESFSRIRPGAETSKEKVFMDYGTGKGPATTRERKA